MSSGFNNNTYVTLKKIKYRDVYSRVTCDLSSDIEIGSSIANSIIVDVRDREEVYGLEGQDYINQMVELKYIKLKV